MCNILNTVHVIIVDNSGCFPKVFRFWLNNRSLHSNISMRKFLLRLRTVFSERLHSDGYRKSMKIGRVLVAVFALIFGISTISGIREDTHAAARLSRSKDSPPDGAILPFDYQFIGQGRVTGGSDNMWLIGNVPVRVDGHTELGNELHPGAFVSLSGRIPENNGWLADRIELAQEDESFFAFNGLLEKVDADMWLIGGHSLIVNAQTVLGENLAVDDIVLATFTVLNSGEWLALEIKAFDRFPVEPTPVPTPTPIQTPASTNPVISNSQPGWNAKPQDGPKKKDRDSKEKKDSKSRGKSASHRKNKK